MTSLPMIGTGPNGTISRSDLTAVLAGKVDVGLYGVKMDGVTDDGPVLQAIIDGTTGDLFLSFPAGTMRSSMKFSTNGHRNITIQGAGSRATRIKFDAGVLGGFDHGRGTVADGSFHIRGIALLPSANSSGTAVRVSSVLLQNPTASAFGAEDVQIGDAALGHYWHIGFQLFGCWNSHIDNTYVFSAGDSAAPGSVAVQVSAAEINGPIGDVTTAMTFDNFFQQGATYGILIQGDVQGINLVNCNITGPRYGIVWNGSSQAGTLQVTNSQLTCSEKHIFVTSVSNVMAMGNLFIQFDQFVQHNTIFMHLVNSAYPTIVGNYLINPGGNVISPNAAILVESTAPVSFIPGRIADNSMLTQCAFPVELRGAVFGIAVHDNDFWNNNPIDPAVTLVKQTAAPTWAASYAYPANSAVVNGGNTYSTIAGGTSGSSGGPTGQSVVTEGTVLWRYVGPSLALYPNPCFNRSYGVGRMTTDAAGNLLIGQRGPGQFTSIKGDVRVDGGADFGSLGLSGFVDLHSQATTGNDYDARFIVDNGASGSNASGDLFVKATSLTVQTARIGFYSHAAAVQPTVAGAKGGNAALTSLLTALAGLGLVVDGSS